MGSNTKGIVTNAKHIDLFAATRALHAALKPYFIRNEKSSLSSTSDLLHFVFDVPEPLYGSATRKLSIFFDCQADHPEFGDNHISLSLQCWGNSGELMKAATLALAQLAGVTAKAFVLTNDAADTEFVDIMPYSISQALEVERLTALVAKAHQLQVGEELSEFSTEMWQADQESGAPQMHYIEWAVNRATVELKKAKLSMGEKQQA